MNFKFKNPKDQINALQQLWTSFSCPICNYTFTLIQPKALRSAVCPQDGELCFVTSYTIPKQCFTEETLLTLLDTFFPKWRSNSSPPAPKSLAPGNPNGQHKTWENNDAH